MQQEPKKSVEAPLPDPRSHSDLPAFKPDMDIVDKAYIAWNDRERMPWPTKAAIIIWIILLLAMVATFTWGM